MTRSASSVAPLSRSKKLLFYVIMAALVIGTAQFISVMYLKLFQGYDGKHLYQYVFDPYKNILPAPGYVDTRGIEHNSQGFRRSGTVTREKQPNTFRIFLMGGSTAYGLGGLWPHIQKKYSVLRNDQTIDAYLERVLNTTMPDLNFEVINAAITSTWTHHELIYLNQSILRYDPDMVLFLDGFNDFFFTNLNHDQFASYSYGLPPRIIMGDPTAYSLAYGNGWWLFRKFALAHVTAKGLRLAKLLITPHPEQTSIDVESDIDNLTRVFPNNALKIQRRVGLILRDEGVAAVYMLQPMLVLERDRTQMPAIERKLFDFNISSYRPHYEEFIQRAVSFIREREFAMSADVGGEFVDLTTVFAKSEGQMFTDYAHLTPQANEIIAKEVTSRILPLIRERVFDSSATDPTAVPQH